MNRTIKEATIRSFHYATLGELRAHLKDYLWAYNYPPFQAGFFRWRGAGRLAR